MTQYYKHPKTYHLPWSLSITSDDKVLPSTDSFHGREVVATIKFDGESTTMYPTHIHARSIDGKSHPSQSWVKGLWSRIKYNIPNGYRVVGENLYAKHSILYEDLESYFYVFNVWDENNHCLSWQDTKLFCDLLGLDLVPVLYEGIFDKKLIKSLWRPSMQDTCEGYVVRLADSFLYEDFNKSVAKFVRPNHVQTNDHWRSQSIIPNELRKVHS